MFHESPSVKRQIEIGTHVNYRSESSILPWNELGDGCGDGYCERFKKQIFNLYFISCCEQGTCVDHVDNYTCQCQPGYTSYDCGIEIDECHVSPCVRGK